MNLRVMSLVVFLSGATGLAYEVIWSKVLADILGNSGQAHAIVLATFMGGLAAGSWLFGTSVDRLERPLLLYAAIELFIGLYALFFPFVQQVAQSTFLSLASHVGDTGRFFSKLSCAALLLLPPTLAMGGTMPTMLKHAGLFESSMRAALGRLYATNSLGAAVGAWLSGTVCLPAWGLAQTARWAAALNLGLAAVTTVAAVRRGRGALKSASLEAAEPQVTPTQARAVIAGLVLSGFTSMVYETGWIRVLTLIVGGSTYAFTWIVCAFIVGIALGSAFIARRSSTDTIRQFGWLQVGVVGSVALSIPLFVAMPWLFLVIKSVLARSEQTFGVWQLVMFVLALTVMVLPTFLMGAAFPLGAKIVSQGHARLGRRLGLVFSSNTAGTVLGALLGGLWLMPTFGLEWLFVTGLFLTALGALSSLFAAPTRRLRWVGALAVVVPLLASATLFRGWAPLLAQLSPFRVDPETVRLGSVQQYLDSYRRSMTTDFSKDDTFATVFVGTATQKEGHRFLLVNGKPDASTGMEDQITQVLLGQVGLLLAPTPPKRVMVVGAGAAVTVGSALTHPIERLDLVEISPSVLEAARFFDDVNHRALDDPRVSIAIDDARTALSLSDVKYDVIISEPSNPWVSGISSLFTREFFEVVDRRLADRGVLVQWIHSYEMNTELVKLVMRTLRERFPEVTAWQGSEGDVLLVASRVALPLNVQDLESRLARAQVREDLGRIGVHLAEGLLARQMMTSAQVARFAGLGALNTDDDNRLEYEAPRAFWAKSSAEIPDARCGRGASSGLALEAVIAHSGLRSATAQAILQSVTAQTKCQALWMAAASTWSRLATDAERDDASLVLSETVARLGSPAHALSLLPPTRDARSVMIEVSALVSDAELQRGPWSPPSPVSIDVWRPFTHGNPALSKMLDRLCRLRSCE